VDASSARSAGTCHRARAHMPSPLVTTAARRSDDSLGPRWCHRDVAAERHHNAPSRWRSSLRTACYQQRGGHAARRQSADLTAPGIVDAPTQQLLDGTRQGAGQPITARPRTDRRHRRRGHVAGSLAMQDAHVGRAGWRAQRRAVGARLDSAPIAPPACSRAARARKRLLSSSDKRAKPPARWSSRTPSGYRPRAPKLDSIPSTTSATGRQYRGYGGCPAHPLTGS
jgi:hypothetical protein